MNRLQISWIAMAAMLLAVSILTSCGHDHHHGPHQEGSSKEPDTKITNRITLPPGAVNNLGITFESASRGKVGSWLSVPGELYVPDTHRWKLRAPTKGRLISVTPRWKKVQEGDVIAELISPALRQAQQKLLAANSQKEIARMEVDAARARLAEGETQLTSTEELESATLKRLEDLRKLNKAGNAFGSRELLSAQRQYTEAGKATLDAAIQRDKLRETAKEKTFLQSKVDLEVEERLTALSVLSGRTPTELLEVQDGTETWQSLKSIAVRSPADGTVVEVFASSGETLEESHPLARVIDASELRFRGWLPEGDLSLLKEDAQVRVALPGGIAPVSTTLLGPRPLADTATRRVQVESRIPNPDQQLPQGLSATAQVQVKESASEEVLLPLSCILSDGLEKIVFLRDAEKPNVVIRTPVELGLRGGGFVEVISGLLEGDTVVDKGKHQLKQTGKGKAPKGGHFHADGTWHLKDE